jgi:hypothetical protein
MFEDYYVDIGIGYYFFGIVNVRNPALREQFTDLFRKKVLLYFYWKVLVFMLFSHFIIPLNGYETYYFIPRRNIMDLCCMENTNVRQ